MVLAAVALLAGCGTTAAKTTKITSSRSSSKSLPGPWTGNGTENLGTIRVPQDTILYWICASCGGKNFIVSDTDVQSNQITVDALGPTSGQTHVDAGTYHDVTVATESGFWSISLGKPAMVPLATPAPQPSTNQTQASTTPAADSEANPTNCPAGTVAADGGCAATNTPEGGCTTNCSPGAPSPDGTPCVLVGGSAGSVQNGQCEPPQQAPPETPTRPDQTSSAPTTCGYLPDGTPAC